MQNWMKKLFVYSVLLTRNKFVEKAWKLTGIISLRTFKTEVTEGLHWPRLPKKKLLHLNKSLLVQRKLNK